MSYVDALRTTLVAEHAAVFVYGSLGAQTSRSAQPSLFASLEAAYAEHRARRDQLTAMIRDEGGEPPAAEPAYDLPPDLSTPAAVMRRALRLERDCAETYAYLVANSPAARRRWAVTALTTAAVRLLGFGGTPETLPGS